MTRTNKTQAVTAAMIAKGAQATEAWYGTDYSLASKAGTLTLHVHRNGGLVLSVNGAVAGHASQTRAAMLATIAAF